MSQATKHIVELKDHKTVWILRFDAQDCRLVVRYRNGSQLTYLKVPQLCFEDLIASLRAGEECVWVFPGLSESHYLNFPIDWWTEARRRDYYIDQNGHVQLDLNSDKGKRLNTLFNSSRRAVTVPLSHLPVKKN